MPGGSGSERWVFERGRTFSLVNLVGTTSLSGGREVVAGVVATGEVWGG